MDVMVRIQNYQQRNRDLTSVVVIGDNGCGKSFLENASTMMQSVDNHRYSGSSFTKERAKLGNKVEHVASLSESDAAKASASFLRSSFYSPYHSVFPLFSLSLSLFSSPLFISPPW